MGKVVGLDFGTTNSAIAVATPDGEAALATFSEDGQRTATFRSVLYFDAENLSMFESWIDLNLQAIANCVDRLLTRCGVSPSDVDSVFLTGGSSFVPAVRHLFEQRFGAAHLRGGGELTTVARGLALHALAQ